MWPNPPWHNLLPWALSCRFIEEGSYSDLTGQVSTLNQLADQLASVNASLNRVNSLDKQPNELLDRRDTLIQDMSKLLRVHASGKKQWCGRRPHW